MLRVVAFCLSLTFAMPAAWADAMADCNQDQDHDRCIRGCTQYIRQNRDPERLASAYHNRGVAYMRKGELGRAIVDYNKVIEFRPHYADAYYNRGVAYRTKGDNDRAIADYTKAIENSPRDGDAFRSRGDAFHSKGDFVRAIADYSKAIEFNPNDAALYTSRGLAYASKGDYVYAVADATKAATLGLTTPAQPKAAAPVASKAKPNAKARNSQ